MIISLNNIKGGVGKTTIAINMASFMASKGDKILLVDADPQGKVLQWQAMTDNNPFDAVHHPHDTLHLDIHALSMGYTHTVIDAPPGICKITMSALLASNLVIVPLEPSPLSTWLSSEIVGLIKDAGKHNRGLIGRFLISRRVAGTVVGRDVRKILDAYGMGLIDTEISQRTDFVRSMLQGLSILEYAPKSDAAKEIRSLCHEVMSNFGQIDFYIPSTEKLSAQAKGMIEELKIEVSEKRQYPRKVPLVVVDFVIQDRAYSGFIHNISEGGAFIETVESFSTGREITMTFASTENQNHIKISGEIVRIEPKGIGVKFQGNI